MKKQLVSLFIVILILSLNLFACKSTDVSMYFLDRYDSNEYIDKKMPHENGNYMYLDKKTFLYGIKNKFGIVVAAPKWHNASDFNCGLASVSEGDNKLYGYIGADGKYKIQPQFKSAYEFIDDVAIVYNQNDKNQLINIDGIPIKLEFDSDIDNIQRISNDYFCVSLKDNSKDKKRNDKIIIDKSGRIIIDDTFYEIFVIEKRNEILAIKRSENAINYICDYHVFTLDTHQLLYKYENIDMGKLNENPVDIVDKYFLTYEKRKKYPILMVNDGYYISYENIKNDTYSWSRTTTLLDTNLDPITDIACDNQGIFTDDLAPIIKDKKTGYINKDGELIIPFSNVLSWNFINGIAPVLDIKNKKGYFINKESIPITITQKQYNDYYRTYSKTDNLPFMIPYYAIPSIDSKIAEYLRYTLGTRLSFDELINATEGKSEILDNILLRNISTRTKQLLEYNRAIKNRSASIEDFRAAVDTILGPEAGKRIYKYEGTEKFKEFGLSLDSEGNVVYDPDSWCGTGKVHSDIRYIPISITKTDTGLYEAVVIPMQNEAQYVDGGVITSLMNISILYDNNLNEVSSVDLFLKNNNLVNHNHTYYMSRNFGYFRELTAKEALKNPNKYLKLKFTLEITDGGLVYFKNVEKIDAK